MMCGGLSQAEPVDAETTEICNTVRGEIESKHNSGASFAEYKPVSVSKQVVAGTNFFVKIDVGGEHIHARIFRPLPHTNAGPEVHSVQRGKTLDDPLTHF